MIGTALLILQLEAKCFLNDAKTSFGVAPKSTKNGGTLVARSSSRETKRSNIHEKKVKELKKLGVKRVSSVDDCKKEYDYAKKDSCTD
jgi:hypothetical protein